MAVHGVSRSTRDLDLLVLAAASLDPDTWQPLRSAGITATIRRGDAADPLAGVIRLTAGDAHPIDVIAGRPAWQAEILARAQPGVIEGVEVPVASCPDLVLLKLYAGGPQDAWDIEQLLIGADRSAVVAGVEAGLPALPAASQALWQRIVGHRPD